MDFAKQLALVIATLNAKRKEMGGIMTKAATESRTNNDTEEAEIAAIEADIGKLETNKSRLEGLIKSAAAAENTATPVAGQTPEQAAASADGELEPEKANDPVVVKSNVPKGVAFAQFAKAKALAVLGHSQGNFRAPIEIAKSMGMSDQAIKALVLDTDNSSALIVQNTIAGEFIELLRAQTIVDKLASKMRAAPFNTKIPGMASGSTAGWVGEGAPKPATNPTFNDVEIGLHKLAGIIVRTDELLKLTSVGADQMFLDDLIEASKNLIDTTFMDAQPQTANRPAGVLNGATAITSTGVTAEAYDADLKLLRQGFISINLSLNGAHYIMSETRASDMAELRDALGNPYYRGMDAGLNQKTLNGLPVIESETASNVIALVKPSELYLADEGQVAVAYSDQATIDMGGATLVNLFQENKVAVRAERYITWTKRRPAAAAFIQYT